jgi:hypothetical protein
VAGGPGAIRPNKLLQNSVVTKIAYETNKSPAQVIRVFVCYEELIAPARLSEYKTWMKICAHLCTALSSFICVDPAWHSKGVQQTQLGFHVKMAIKFFICKDHLFCCA